MHGGGGGGGGDESTELLNTQPSSTSVTVLSFFLNHTVAVACPELAILQTRKHEGSPAAYGVAIGAQLLRRARTDDDVVEVGVCVLSNAVLHSSLAAAVVRAL